MRSLFVFDVLAIARSSQPAKGSAWEEHINLFIQF